MREGRPKLDQSNAPKTSVFGALKLGTDEKRGQFQFVRGSDRVLWPPIILEILAISR